MGTTKKDTNGTQKGYKVTTMGTTKGQQWKPLEVTEVPRIITPGGPTADLGLCKGKTSPR